MLNRGYVGVLVDYCNHYEISSTIEQRKKGIAKPQNLTFMVHLRIDPIEKGKSSSKAIIFKVQPISFRGVLLVGFFGGLGIFALFSRQGYFDISSPWDFIHPKIFVGIPRFCDQFGAW